MGRGEAQDGSACVLCTRVESWGPEPFVPGRVRSAHARELDWWRLDLGRGPTRAVGIKILSCRDGIESHLYLHLHASPWIAPSQFALGPHGGSIRGPFQNFQSFLLFISKIVSSASITPVRLFYHFFFFLNLLWFKCYLVWFRTYLFSGKVALVTPRCPKKKWALTSKAVATLGSFFQGPAILVC